MQGRFNVDRSLIRGFAVLLLVCVTVMVLSTLLIGRFLQTVIVPAIFGTLILIFYFGFTRGTYVSINGTRLTVTRLFVNGRASPLSDVISIHSRPTFGGLMSSVYMKVRNKDGTISKHGLINKPGMTDMEYKRLFDMMRSINHDIEIDQSVLRR
jgi:hypothetical protein